MNTPSMNDVEKRTNRIWFDDGLWEMGFGVILFLIGLCGYLIWKNNPQGPLGLAAAFGQMGIIIGGFYALNFVLRWLKERITYPRLGYAAYRKPVGRTKLFRILRSCLIAAFTGGLVALVASLNQTEAYMPVITSAFIAISVFYLGFRFGLLRYIAVAVIILLFGIYVSFLHLETELAIATLFAGMGMLWLLSGGITLAFFLRSTPPATPINLTPEGQ